MNDHTIVIGAGLAGLSAASDLRAAGRSVTVLEATARPGGRVVLMTHHGDAAEAGAQGIHTGYTRLLELVERHGLTADLVPQANQQACYLDRSGRQVYPAGILGMSKLLGLRGTAELSWFLARYVSMMKRFSLYETHRDIPEYDNISIAEAFQWAGDAFKDYFLHPAAHAMVGTNIEHTNLYHFLNLIKLIFTTKVMTLRGGNASLAEKIAASLEVRYECPVEKLLYEKGRVTGVLLTSGEVLKAAHVIVACPIDAAAKLMPEALGVQRAFLTDFPNVPLTLVYFFLNQPLNTKAYVYMGHGHRTTTFNMALNHTVKTPHLVPSGKGIVSAWPCYPDSLGLAQQSNEAVTAKALEDMQLFFPGIAGMVDEVKIQRHPWGFARLSPGTHAKILGFKQQAEQLRGVSFASNDYDGVHMESAVQSGVRAAERVIRGR
ncbi:FAD-dependent oxidoreductase [Pseudomonas sp. B21-028]|uniref:flavin monoamine oxidase family protein n=1 Tax=Pseudomonas TaxID=286 RepID=UPI00216090DC|nr:MULTISPECIES: NAD(P)/FAD-dependent oxidoreductase [Pseudomonas]UVL86081.1 FAD-dependent oxidoreductase [Pseudomonas sp. B21-028]UVM70490.1 FAD-dependent oxidoreductase [Pseudomonas canavaninivorans]